MQLIDYWPIFAFLSAILWTCVSLFDKYSVHSIFSSPIQGIFVAGFFSLSGLFFLPFTSWSNVTLQIVLSAFLAGIFIQLGQLAYFFAIYEEDVGDLTALASTYPLAVALFGLIYGQTLTLIQWVGVIIVVSSTIVLRGLKRTDKKPFRSFLLILCYVLALAISAIIVSTFLDEVHFHDQFPFYCLGLVAGSLLPLFWQKNRKLIYESIGPISANFYKFGSIEIINLAALGCEVFALGKGHPAVVTAISSTEPAFAFIFVNFLAQKKIVAFKKVDRLFVKICAVTVLALGLGLLA